MVDQSFLRRVAERRPIFEIHLKQMALQTHDLNSMCSRFAGVHCSIRPCRRSEVSCQRS
jgi:hypothetical protein